MTTIALAQPSGWLPRQAAHWSLCFAIVLLAHAGGAAALLYHFEAEDPYYGVDSSVVMLELPETLLQSNAPPTTLAPGPKEEEAEEVPKEETKPPEPEAEVALPMPEPKPVPPEVKQATAPPSAAPTVSAVHRWETDLVAHIERFKRYPVDARDRGEQGIARVAFAVDHEGWLTTKRIVRSSGFAELDQEALEMLTRAQPVPRPPDRIADRELYFVVPVRFNIR